MMGCNRGKASPNTNTERRLFAASGGYCQNPNCNAALFIELETTTVSIAEMAHIFAVQDDGPRANAVLTDNERGTFANLILLCANCHTIIDKAPAVFPDSIIVKWKSEHESRIASAFGAVAYETRTNAHKALLGLMARTGAIHRRVGPDNDYRWNPEADEADEWKHQIRRTIIPINRSILSLLDHNRTLLRKCEIETVELFRQHIVGMEQRHIFDKPLPSSPKYPDSMAVLLED